MTWLFNRQLHDIANWCRERQMSPDRTMGPDPCTPASLKRAFVAAIFKKIAFILKTDTSGQNYHHVTQVNC
jgi:hypothetical protein